MLQSMDELAPRLSRASSDRACDVDRDFTWPERLDPELWCMSPELVSLYGTEVWEGLSEPRRRVLSFYEIVNFFSVVLQGERPLVQGLAERLYSRHASPEVTEYLHHFIEEENRHMAMFGRFCNRYAGKVYPDKKIPLEQDYAPGEEEVVFFCKVLVIEELGDFYNRVMMRDARIEPIVRALNRAHHVDESRHLVFGRAHLRELFERWSPTWSPTTLKDLREWLGDYLRLCWSDFYSPTMYQDAGFADGFAVRRVALSSPACVAHRRLASARLVKSLLATDILEEVPAT